MTFLGKIRAILNYFQATQRHFSITSPITVKYLPLILLNKEIKRVFTVFLLNGGSGSQEKQIIYRENSLINLLFLRISQRILLD